MLFSEDTVWMSGRREQYRISWKQHWSLLMTSVMMIRRRWGIRRWIRINWREIRTASRRTQTNQAPSFPSAWTIGILCTIVVQPSNLICRSIHITSQPDRYDLCAQWLSQRWRCAIVLWLVIIVYVIMRFVVDKLSKMSVQVIDPGSHKTIIETLQLQSWNLSWIIVQKMWCGQMKRNVLFEMSTPLMKNPDFTRTFLLQTDALGVWVVDVLKTRNTSRETTFHNREGVSGYCTGSETLEGLLAWTPIHRPNRPQGITIAALTNENNSRFTKWSQILQPHNSAGKEFPMPADALAKWPWGVLHASEGGETMWKTERVVY